MLFDDRLATVLRQRAAGERGARTQYRQLLDLLGARDAVSSPALARAAVARLGELADGIPAAEQSRILREPGQRLRNPALVEWLAQGEPQAAAAAVATARLDEAEWIDLIPRLPVNARGFLRHRRDLPPRVRELLARLGVQDLVLRDEGSSERAPVKTPDIAPDRGARTPISPARKDGVGELLQRIESFRQRRAGENAARDQQRLPLGDGTHGEAASLDFQTDAGGTIVWAEGDVGADLLGLALGTRDKAALLAMPEGGARAMGLRQPLVHMPLLVHGIAGLEGAWRIDAAPWFRDADGAFMGYRGRLRRPAPVAATPHAADDAATRMRQVLHELRTPVNAIQGFAEIIQQQVFGPAPNSYRALAAAIGVDAARLLAGFDEVEQLARLETGAAEREEGEADLRAVVADTVQRLAGVLRPRSAELRLMTSGGPFATALAKDDARMLGWRLLATLAGGMAPGEVLDLALEGDGECVTLSCRLPLALADQDDPFAAAVDTQARAISAGMFGSGFTLRLARAEAEAAGGTLALGEDGLRLTLPALTQAGARHSDRA